MLFRKKKDEETPFIEGVQLRNNVYIFRLQGSIDMDSIPQIYNLWDKAKDKKTPLDKNILLDFADVRHVDTATCALLLRALSEIKKGHHKLGLINIPHELKSMIEIDNLSGVLDVYNSEEEALEELNPGQ